MRTMTNSCSPVLTCYLQELLTNPHPLQLKFQRKQSQFNSTKYMQIQKRLISKLTLKRWRLFDEDAVLEKIAKPHQTKNKCKKQNKKWGEAWAWCLYIQAKSVLDHCTHNHLQLGFFKNFSFFCFCFLFFYLFFWVVCSSHFHKMEFKKRKTKKSILFLPTGLNLCSKTHLINAAWV